MTSLFYTQNTVFGGKMNEIEKEIERNETLKEVQQLLIKQTEKGLLKYGRSVEPDALTSIEWLTHMQEEMLDGLIYATIAKRKIKELLEGD